MLKVALLWACLASVGNGRYLQAPKGQLRRGPRGSQKLATIIFSSPRSRGQVRDSSIQHQVRAIARLLLAFKPEVSQVTQAVNPVLRPYAAGSRPLAAGGSVRVTPLGGWFDGATVGGCVVRRRGPSDWMMWYSGRSTGYAVDVIGIGTGHIGIAVSHDGLIWREVAGKENFGSVLAPTRATGDFGSSHVGVGDVVIGDDGKYTMYMFGGDDKRPVLGDNRLPKGSVMRIGVAHSADGIVWERMPDPILEPSDDQLFVGWPQLATVPTGNEGQARHLLYYHAMKGGKMEICVAELTGSELEGQQSWEKHGCCLQATPGTFYAGGVSARHVMPDPDTSRPRGSLLMFFEAQNEARSHSIGLARSEDGLEWTVVGEEPVFRPATEEDAWDGSAVSRPWLVPMEDGSARLYYLGRSGDKKQAIGVAESNGTDWTTWRRL